MTEEGRERERDRKWSNLDRKESGSLLGILTDLNRLVIFLMIMMISFERKGKSEEMCSICSSNKIHILWEINRRRVLAFWACSKFEFSFYSKTCVKRYVTSYNYEIYGTRNRYRFDYC